MIVRRALLGLSLAASVCGGSPVLADDLHLHAVLVGGNETPNPGSTKGYGTAAVQFRGADNTEVCVGIIVTGLDKVLAAHIHKGFGPVAGDIVVVLPEPKAGNPGGSTGCIKIDEKLASDILADPYGFYINVHTKKFPTGAIRGQLF